MYPELFSIYGYTVSTFGLMLAVGFLAGSWITSLRMIEEGLDPEQATTILVYVIIGGVVGSKLYFAVDISIREEDRHFWDLLLSRDGMTWYGGLIMAMGTGIIGCRIHGVPVKTFFNCAAVAVAVGQAFGRIGCFLVGDDYGRVTDVAWAIAFPQGAPPTDLPVHPTQLYEVAWLLPVAAFLWSRRKKSPFLFGEYLALNGFGRVIIENWRVNPKMALGLTEPQWIGALLVVFGVGSWIHFRRRLSD
jgi:phosphatidylglycerol:prolipoprotein diacylglycerol transferase